MERIFADADPDDPLATAAGLLPTEETLLGIPVNDLLLLPPPPAATTLFPAGGFCAASIGEMAEREE